METRIFREWFQERINVADEIVSQHGSKAESDAEIILCCAISALAATVWPGKGIDRKRYIQLLIEFTPPKFDVQKISVIHLVSSLQDKAQLDAANILISARFKSELAYLSKSPMTYGYLDGEPLYAGTLSPIFDPAEVDLDEVEAFELIPKFEKSEIRRSSYASIIYSELRSGLVHEYELFPNLASRGWPGKEDQLCYINFLKLPKEDAVSDVAKRCGISEEQARNALSRTERRLYFPYSFIRNLIKETAESVFVYWESAEEFTKPKPASWWITSS